LYCPVCEYNLTLLTSNRCPECGNEIDWELARWIVKGPQGGFTPFERWPWLLKPLGFITTALWVLILPWRFARRITPAPRQIWAHTFALLAVSIGIVGFIVLYKKNWDWAYVWGVPVWFHIEAEALVFLLIAGPLRRARNTPGRRYRLWRTIALYTTGVLAFEFFTGPPTLGFGEGNIWPWSLDWPDDLMEAAISVLYHCWWLSVWTIVIFRSRSRWRGFLAGATLPLISWVAYGIGLALW
jgi:hypothetical protein